jgi:Zn-dependent protease/CBS domain-containing protein
MPGSLHLGTIAGIRLELHFSWVIILVLLTFSLATGWFPAAVSGYTAGVYWSISLLAALLLFVAVLAHELAHSLVAQARGLPVKRITLFIFGGVSDLEQEPPSAGVEFQMAFVGPLTSLLIGVLAWLAAKALDGQVPLLRALLGYLAIMNLLLAGFNLLPGFPLDGGRVLRSILWKVTGSLRTATRWTALVGQGIGSLLIVGGIWLFFAGDWVNGLWFGFLGWFLLQAAQTAQSQQTLETVFRGVTVAQIMRPVEVVVFPTCSLQRLVDGYLLPLGLRTIPVVEGEQLVGLITLSDVRQVPREAWKDTLVGQVMRPRATLHLATPDQGVREVLQLLARYSINQVPVVQHERLVGMVSREAIVNFLEVRQSLGLLGGKQGGAGSQPDLSQRQTSAPLPLAPDHLADSNRWEHENGEQQELMSKP